MRTFENFARTPITIGYLGENLVTGIDVDLSSVIHDGWTASLLLKRPGETTVYIKSSTLSGNILHADFTIADTAKTGTGEANIVLYGEQGEIKKTAATATKINYTLSVNGTPPEPTVLYRTAAQQDVIDAGKISKAAQSEKTEEMTQPVGVDADGKLWALPGGGGGSSVELWRPTVNPDGDLSWAKSSSETPPATQNIKGQQGTPGRDGQDGAPGQDGEDGYSPAVTVTTITGGHSVKITDKQHPDGQSFNVLDGTDGQDGQDGTDGHSPVVTATKSGKVTTVKVDGTAIATINDGNDGAQGNPGAAAGFGTPTATVDASVGTPSVTVTATGADTSKVFSFAFHNLKGQQGAAGQDGADGADGKSAYESAQDGGYTGTEQQFNSDLADVGEKIGEAPNDGQQYARKNKAWAVVQGGGGGTGDHTELTNRDAADQHPISAITGLNSALDNKIDASGGTMTGSLTITKNEAIWIPNSGYILNAGGVRILGVRGSNFEVGNNGRPLNIRGSQTRPLYNETESLALLSDLSTKADKPTIKTTMDAVAVTNTQYYLGTIASVSITMPTTGISVGDEFLVVFTSGATAATLTCDLTGFSFTPKANKTSWLKFTCYDATNGDWLVETKEG